MRKEIIKQLLERYWLCETSLEEEQQLMVFFSGNKVPDELKKYIPLFQLKNKNQSVKADIYLSRIPVEEKPRRIQLYPVMKIAASFLLVVTLGIGIYTHYQQEQFLDAMFSETYTEPGEAVKHTGEIMAKVSSLLQLVPDIIIPKEEADTMDIKTIETSGKSVNEKIFTIGNK